MSQSNGNAAMSNSDVPHTTDTNIVQPQPTRYQGYLPHRDVARRVVAREHTAGFGLADSPFAALVGNADAGHEPSLQTQASAVPQLRRYATIADRRQDINYRATYGNGPRVLDGPYPIAVTRRERVAIRPRPDPDMLPLLRVNPEEVRWLHAQQVRAQAEQFENEQAWLDDETLQQQLEEALANRPRSRSSPPPIFPRSYDPFVLVGEPQHPLGIRRPLDYSPYADADVAEQIFIGFESQSPIEVPRLSDNQAVEPNTRASARTSATPSANHSLLSAAMSSRPPVLREAMSRVRRYRPIVALGNRAPPRAQVQSRPRPRQGTTPAGVTQPDPANPPISSARPSSSGSDTSSVELERLRLELSAISSGRPSSSGSNTSSVELERLRLELSAISSGRPSSSGSNTSSVELERLRLELTGEQSEDSEQADSNTSRRSSEATSIRRSSNASAASECVEITAEDYRLIVESMRRFYENHPSSVAQEQAASSNQTPRRGSDATSSSYSSAATSGSSGSIPMNTRDHRMNRNFRINAALFAELADEEPPGSNNPNTRRTSEVSSSGGSSAFSDSSGSLPMTTLDHQMNRDFRIYAALTAELIDELNGQERAISNNQDPRRNSSVEPRSPTRSVGRPSPFFAAWLERRDIAFASALHDIIVGDRYSPPLALGQITSRSTGSPRATAASPSQARSGEQRDRQFSFVNEQLNVVNEEENEITIGYLPSPTAQRPQHADFAESIIRPSAPVNPPRRAPALTRRRGRSFSPLGQRRAEEVAGATERAQPSSTRLRPITSVRVIHDVQRAQAERLASVFPEYAVIASRSPGVIAASNSQGVPNPAAAGPSTAAPVFATEAVTDRPEIFFAPNTLFVSEFETSPTRKRTLKRLGSKVKKGLGRVLSKRR